MNTDTSAQDGSHWLVIYVDDRCNGYIYDSLGFDGMYRGRILKMIHGNAVCVTKNRLQSMGSQTCGAYALYVARKIAKDGIDASSSWLSSCSKADLLPNDVFVQSYLWKVFGTFLEIF